ncbi:hypothetical protein GCM10023085_70910 [Actinomadura viridis]|uniref:Translation initiation factor IF-2 n=1 Tax=Actinomadura viridis TaxID=58110 RepID=A0A931DNV8_9ACTN|nr:hypothetical protein [Actinomadura viridis]MBG6090053.1 hypothetical protein [Actinomadura viridis]
MPQQQRRLAQHGPRSRLGRIGAASALSAGALTLMALSAPPAAAAAPRPCPKGTDPASTIDNWKCQLDNIRDGLEPKDPAPSPAPAPAPTKKPPKKTPETSPAKPPRRKADPPSGKDRGAPGRQVAPPPMSPQSRPYSVQPYSTGGAPQLPGLLPAPQVAGPQGAAQGGPMPRTRLTAPVAASERQDAPATLWVAAAAGAAGMVGAFNISFLGRDLRRRHARSIAGRRP